MPSMPVSKEIQIAVDVQDVCIEEGEEVRASVVAIGGNPEEPLQYQWFRTDVGGSELKVEGQTRAELHFVKTTRTLAGRYRVTVWCNSQPKKKQSRTMRLRVTKNIREMVSKIVRTKGTKLTDDSPRVVEVDFAG